MHKLTLWMSLMLLVVGLMLQPLAARAQDDEALEPLKVILLSQMSFAPYFIADAEGFFAEQGVEVEFVSSETSIDLFPALAQGEIDVFAGAINIGILNAIAREGNVRIVADKGYFAADGCTSIGFVARPELLAGDALTDPEQLSNLVYDIRATNFQGYLIEQALTAYGVALEDLTTERLPRSAVLPALESGALDVSMTGEPQMTQVINAGVAELWIGGEAIVPDFQFAAIVFGPSLLEDHPEAGEHFITAYLQAVAQYNEGKTERNLDILAEATGLDRDVLESMCWASIRLDGSINAESVVDFQEWALSHDLADAVVAADDFWDGRFIEAAAATLGLDSAE